MTALLPEDLRYIGVSVVQLQTTAPGLRSWLDKVFWVIFIIYVSTLATLPFYTELIAYADLGTEAIYRLVVEDFPLVVANDAHGGDLYEQGRDQWRKDVQHAHD